LGSSAESACWWSSSGWQRFGSRTVPSATNGDSPHQHDHAAADQLNRGAPNWDGTLKRSGVKSDELGSAGQHAAINHESEQSECSRDKSGWISLRNITRYAGDGRIIDCRIIYAKPRFVQFRHVELRRIEFWFIEFRFVAFDFGNQSGQFGRNVAERDALPPN
jgi:hypothetical protein